MSTKSAFWQSHLIAWRTSGLSQAAYCHLQGLSLPCFGYWRSKLRESLPLPPPAAKALLPIVVSELSGSDKCIEVELPNGLQVRFPSDMDEARCVSIIRALREC
ncbi:MAG: hypothetical protein KGJ97_11665 [Xanthomonadaceae bacterium]|nr:hypothetical protein [Xanthomonadaceae bacterium]MDE3071242.1 IS66 family insertion sequence element accessory protein TnpB [Pseudomonadota bacterium]